MPCVRETLRCSDWTFTNRPWYVFSVMSALYQLGRLPRISLLARGRVALPFKSLALSVMFRLSCRPFVSCSLVIRWLRRCRDKNCVTLFVAPPSPTCRLNCCRSTCPLPLILGRSVYITLTPVFGLGSDRRVVVCEFHFIILTRLMR